MPERDDPELGRMRLCRGCDEEWPKDPEFWFYDRHGTIYGNCRACESDRRLARYRNRH